jgi:hypothetical protein
MTIAAAPPPLRENHPSACIHQLLPIQIWK